ncbi:MAG: hypothetical protein HQ582_33325 [Planctomycetes bacterium]|nr:hypothetical protein [Planctomycetota bacterium]
MRNLTEAEKQELAEEARREFPDDDVMRQVHYVRLLHQAQTRGLSSQERVRFFGVLETERHA